jgi:hypothetical protein
LPDGQIFGQLFFAEIFFPFLTPLNLQTEENSKTGEILQLQYLEGKLFNYDYSPYIFLSN